MKKIGFLAAVPLVSAMLVQPAEAVFVAQVCDLADCSGAVVTVVDNGAGDTLPGIDGFINFTAVGIGGVDVTVNTSQSKPALQSGMDITFTVTDIVGAGGTVYLIAADTDFVGAATLGGTIGGTADSGSVTASYCGGDSNDQFNTAPCQTSAALGAGPYAASFGSLSTSADPYSLFLSVAVTLTGPGTSTGDFRVIPEPVTVAMFGLGLVAVGAVARRRQNAKA